MLRNDFFVPGRDDWQIASYHWPSALRNPKAVILILHGMAEYALRYESFARALTPEGFDVYACDHRGHGRTGLNKGPIGFFAPKNGWFTVVDDILTLVSRIKHDHPGLPLFLYGHSMGSFLARSCMVQPEQAFKGIIISGTSVEKPLLIKASIALTSLLIRFQGSTKQSALLNQLTFGSFNKLFKPNRTKFDWLSRENTEVDSYCQDPLCGFICTLGFFRDLFEGILYTSNPAPLQKMIYKPPVLILSGTCDPVSHEGKDVGLLADAYSRLGVTDLSTKLYKNARHELLHEVNQQEVTNDIIAWLNNKLH